MSYASPTVATSSCDSPRESSYTYHHLQLLRQNSPWSPLRVIAHVDLDAFYAQCEMVRLGISRQKPLAVRQWNLLIAVNYAARPFGITRLLSPAEAKKRCPELLIQHVATFKEGEGGTWAYRDDPSESTDKVSLDPYRAESRKILSVMKEELSRRRECLAEIEKDTQTQLQPAILEKASIDEVFIDLSSLVFGVLLLRYPELRKGFFSDDKTTHLPPPPRIALGWVAEDAVISLEGGEMQELVPNWDDIVLAIGSEISHSVRKAIWEKLGYTCSAGIARNKMIAKLGSGYNKPSGQTIILNRATQRFLGGFKFTKIRMLGGKLGNQVSSLFGTEEVSELLSVPVERFKARLPDDTAVWLYDIIRGKDHSEVNPRTQIKSMLSTKSFRPSINSVDQAEKWLQIFVADLYGRLVEDGLLENKRRPKILTLHHRQGAQIRSRQTPISGGKSIEETALFDLSRALLSQVVADGRAWPCIGLSLGVGGFEDGVTNNRPIDGFLVRGEDVKSTTFPTSENATPFPINKSCKRKGAEDDGIHRFFKKEHKEEFVNQLINEPQDMQDPNGSICGAAESNTMGFDGPEDINNYLLGHSIPTYFCDRCRKFFPEFERDEHDDWHFAKELEAQDTRTAKLLPNMQIGASQVSKSSGNQKARGLLTDQRELGRSEKGQTRLAFG